MNAAVPKFRKIQKFFTNFVFLFCSLYLLDHTDRTIVYNKLTFHNPLHIAPLTYHCTKALDVCLPVTHNNFIQVMQCELCLRVWLSGFWLFYCFTYELSNKSDGTSVKLFLFKFSIGIEREIHMYRCRHMIDCIFQSCLYPTLCCICKHIR